MHLLSVVASLILFFPAGVWSGEWKWLLRWTELQWLRTGWWYVTYKVIWMSRSVKDGCWLLCNCVVSPQERVMASRLRDTPLPATVSLSRAWTATVNRLHLKPLLGERFGFSFTHPPHISQALSWHCAWHVRMFKCISERCLSQTLVLVCQAWIFFFFASVWHFSCLCTAKMIMFKGAHYILA